MMRVDATRILTLDEVRRVIQHWKRKRRYVCNRQALVVFRLATCCGLRASEIAGLTVDDVRLEGQRPHLRIRKSVGKGKKARNVPMWWDQGTLDDLRAWRAEQVSRGVGWFVSTQSRGACGHKLDRRHIRRIFQRVCRVLPGRETATTHDGRHTFVSLALAAGRGLAQVRDAAGHASANTTNIYLHAVPDDGTVGSMFS